jgi:hypothetical protein
MANRCAVQLFAVGFMMSQSVGAAPIEAQLRFTVVGEGDGCRTVEVLAYQRSKHPRPGHFQEHNHGTGLRCSASPESRFSWLLAGLENSQRGSTLAAGAGLRFSAPRWHSLGAHVGLDITGIIYEEPARGRAVAGVLHIPYYGLSYELPGRAGILGYNENRLAYTGIKLYNFSWQFSF